MLPKIATNCVALLVMASMWWMTCQGYVVLDAETDGDDMWPVLCPPNTFYSKKQDQCLACSQCPANKIIITECHGLHDTWCGPLYQSNAQSPPANETGNNHRGTDQASQTAHTKHKLGVSSQDSTKSTSEFTDFEWKFVTICLFVFLALAAIVTFMVVVYLSRQKDSKEKKILCEYAPPVEAIWDW
ncbi:unnamed protein product [Candidula unifasciata]|uniref:TNFR-Cys domain-containing protein n=1 Tax=Candidula unifasciata TaxID=100452 RepID=A0A8S3ZU74_9EUPU|nr:unnamed protein product [Candidula unifasciata]